MKIENWSLIFAGSEYTAPEAQEPQIRGKVFGNAVFDEGDKIVTSIVKRLDIESKKAYTKNNTYDLGEPDVEWLTWLEKNNHKLVSF